MKITVSTEAAIKSLFDRVEALELNVIKLNEQERERSKPVFVSAKVVTEKGIEVRQGWLLKPGILVGESGSLHVVKSVITNVFNPPEKMSEAALKTASYILE